MLALETSRSGENGRAAPGATPYHHGDLRRALLQAAEALLERGGGHAALSLREVARAAGVSHAAPYRHFADREALLAALAADGFARLADALTAAAAAAPEGGRTRAAGRAYLRFARAHRALYLLMFGPEIRKSAHPALAAAAGAAMAALRGAGEADRGAADRGAADRGGSGEAARARHAMVGAWALVHGLAHLIADGQLAEDLAADDYMALSEDVLATYGAGLRAKQG